jgi:hypothetical protein
MGGSTHDTREKTQKYIYALLVVVLKWKILLEQYSGHTQLQIATAAAAVVIWMCSNGCTVRDVVEVNRWVFCGRPT